MKIRKTRQEKRSDYSYPINVQVGSDKWETKFITIRPGEDGVTEADIKTLHSLDDKEVYNNNKNMHPKKQMKKKLRLKNLKLPSLLILKSNMVMNLIHLMLKMLSKRPSQLIGTYLLIGS